MTKPVTSNRTPRWEMIAFAIIWLGLCGFFSFGALRGVVAQREAASRYRPVDARVTEAVLISIHTNANSSAGRTRYQARLTYSYTVRGRRFSSSQYSLDGAGEWTDLEDAAHTVTGNPAGSKIQAFYDLDDPARAVVNLGTTSTKILWIILSFSIFGLNCLCFRGLPRGATILGA
jgi:hypothetical protein